MFIDLGSVFEDSFVVNYKNHSFIIEKKDSYTSILFPNTFEISDITSKLNVLGVTFSNEIKNGNKYWKLFEAVYDWKEHCKKYNFYILKNFERKMKHKPISDISTSNLIKLVRARLVKEFNNNVL